MTEEILSLINNYIIVHTKLDIYVCITFRVDISTGEPHVPAGILRPVGGVLALTRFINSIYVIEI
jgi:hypothetical protein